MISRASGSGNWQYDYNVGQTRIYLIEEWEFLLLPDPFDPTSNLLSVVPNRQTSDPLHLAYGITGMEILIELKDGSTVNSFSATDDWSEIASVSVSIEAEESYKSRVVKLDLDSKFFPRNIMSL